MSYGPHPWLQKSWDARAAGNFMFGGAGAGLLAFTALSGWRGPMATALWLAGMGLVSSGLLLVWFEIGRPWRAINVFANPRTSWMSREAYVAAALLLLSALAALGVAAYAGLVASLALAFVYCQARILRQARGIPAWREPMTTPLVMISGLAEGGGLFCAAWALTHGGRPAALGAFAAALLVRTLLGRIWRTRLSVVWHPRPARALDATVAALWHWGGLLPLALLLVSALLPLPDGVRAAALVVAGGLAMAAGQRFKYLLVTRAAFNQGFTLTQLPVRGVRRTPSTP
jgi:phenylacetyl-CoA:acceptor oxidoreductase 26-kDa subunit